MDSSDQAQRNGAIGGIAPVMLGPFLGHTTTNTVKVWLHLESEVEAIYVTVNLADLSGPLTTKRSLHFRKENLWTDCVSLNGLAPDTWYIYQLWTDAACSAPLDLQGLEYSELRFRTLPDDRNAQIDFLLMSCHNPTVSKADGFDGYAVWADIPQLISAESNKNVQAAEKLLEVVRTYLK
jgi:hypothetical protein